MEYHDSHDLNFSNRLVRTRMPGGVAGARLTAAPYADQVTPHRWTPFYATVADRDVIETDIRRWDYKHQVLATPGLPAWRIFMWFKCLELAIQLRPKVL